MGVLVHPPPEKFGINKLWSTILGIFLEYFFKKVNLVQLGIIFPSECILFSILSKISRQGKCLLLAMALGSISMLLVLETVESFFI